MSVMSLKPRNMSDGEWKSLGMGLLFVSPWILGFVLFTIYPLIASVYYSLTRYDIVRDPVFIGAKNYTTIFTTDPHFWDVMYNTMFYVVLSVPLGIISAFFIANLLSALVWAPAYLLPGIVLGASLELASEVAFRLVLLLLLQRLTWFH